MKAIGLRDVSVRFGGVEALDRVDLDLDAGEVTLLAGPNGSGKSTLLGVLLGLVRAHAGTLLVDGVPRRTDRDFRRRLGYLPEAVAFAPNLTARQVLRFFAEARGVPASRVPEVLARVHLAGAAGRATRGYSRGMLQRLGIAVAVLAEPELLVLDEPTGGLDQAGLTVLTDIVAEWRAEGRFVLLASHDLVLMESRVQRVVMLADGRVCASGTPAALRRQAGLAVRVHFELDPARETPGVFAERLAGLGLGPVRPNGRFVVAEVPADRLLGAIEASGGSAVKGIRVEEPGFDAIYDAVLKGKR